MDKKFISREEVPIAQPGEKTYGFKIFKEIWKTEKGEEIFWKYSLPNVVQIFARTTDGKIIAVSEFQPGLGTDYVHLPGETMEKGETPLITARRGLLEETGYVAQKLTLLSTILENSGHSDRLVHIVFADGCYKRKDSAEAEIETVLIEAHNLWQQLMKYFLANPAEKHGGGNTFKAAALGLHAIGCLPCRFQRQ